MGDWKSLCGLKIELNFSITVLIHHLAAKIKKYWKTGNSWKSFGTEIYAPFELEIRLTAGINKEL